MDSKKILLPLLVTGLLLMSSCSKDSPAGPDEYDVEIIPADFVAGVDNPFWPLTPGTVMIYEGESGGESERVVIEVSDETKQILGVTCMIVRDRVWAAGELVEDTYDWYAQHQNDDVWYFGEDSKEIEDGEVVSTEGSWESGVDDALPGIVMKGDPQIDESYRQEYYEGEAEDMAKVLSLDESVSVAYGAFTGCLKTKEWTPLEPGVSENKYYAAGLGLILEEAAQGGTGRSELVEVLPPVPPVNPGDYTLVIDNPYFPLVPGTTFTYEGESDGEMEQVVVEVTHDTKVILGVSCRVVRDRVYVADELAEDTFDWYAQHTNGDVWYFGEDSKEYENGEVVSTAGSWEAGVGGARAGVLMKGGPQIGDTYRQEFFAGEAEDKAEVLSLSASAAVPYGEFTDCLQTLEWTPLSPGVSEHKYYALGVGHVLEVMETGGEGRVELVTVENE